MTHQQLAELWLGLIIHLTSFSFGYSEPQLKATFSHLDTNVVHSSGLVLLQEAGYGALLPQRMQKLQLSVSKLNEHCVDTVLGQRHLVAHSGPQHVSIQCGGLFHVRNSDGNVIEPSQVP